MPENKPDRAQSGEAHENSVQENLIFAVKNNPCSVCRANLIPPPCKGHGKQSGSGTGDSTEAAAKSDVQASADSSGQSIDTMDQAVFHAANPPIDEALTQQAGLTAKIFSPEIISDLLSKNFLLIDNNQDSGILTIKLQCKPHLLSEEQREELKKFVDIILEELDKFKKEKSITANCAIIDKDDAGNFLTLSITLPTPTVYDAFIQRLASKYLLPKQNIEQKENIVYEENTNHFNPTPLSTKPTLAMNKGVKQATIEEEKSSYSPR